jgi:hypothetical protein
VLLRWKDGRLTGLFGHNSHIYVVMNMGGNLHAVLEPTQACYRRIIPPTRQISPQGTIGLCPNPSR